MKRALLAAILAIACLAAPSPAAVAQIPLADDGATHQIEVVLGVSRPNGGAGASP